MKLQLGRMSKSRFGSRLRSTGHREPEAAASVSAAEYRIQVQLLRSRNRRLEQALAEALEASEVVLGAQQRREAELLLRLDQSRSDFEVAWTGFSADIALDDQLSSLHPGDDRARRWLLTP